LVENQDAIEFEMCDRQRHLAEDRDPGRKHLLDISGSRKDDIAAHAVIRQVGQPGDIRHLLPAHAGPVDPTPEQRVIDRLRPVGDDRRGFEPVPLASPGMNRQFSIVTSAGIDAPPIRLQPQRPCPPEHLFQ
jgi:hypothetical protein